MSNKATSGAQPKEVRRGAVIVFNPAVNSIRARRVLWDLAKEGILDPGYFTGGTTPKVEEFNPEEGQPRFGITP